MADETPPAPPIPIVQLRGVSVRFGSQTVLAGIDLDIFPQDTLCVIGESGCGKTVLLKLIVGLLKPTDGEVLFENKPLHQLSEHDLTRLRLRVGFLFQQAALFDSLNVFDNVAFGELADRRVFEQYFALGRLQQPDDELEQHGFAAAAFADHTERVLRENVEVDAREHGLRAETHAHAAE